MVFKTTAGYVIYLVHSPSRFCSITSSSGTSPGTLPYARPGITDRLLWKWTSDQTFSTASAYRSFFIGQYSIPGAKILAKTRAPGKCKFFGWLAIHDRCWTAARRKRHGLQNDDNCALCCQNSETVTHLGVCLVPTNFPNFPSHPLSHWNIKYSKWPMHGVLNVVK